MKPDHNQLLPFARRHEGRGKNGRAIKRICDIFSRRTMRNARRRLMYLYRKEPKVEHERD